MGSIEPSVYEPGPAFKTPWIETPLVESANLSRAAGCRVFLKLENVQPSGSFKSRAMGNQILSHLRNPAYANRPVHFYASSGGNAGLAAVCAARSLGYPCTVVVPLGTKPLMLQKIRAAGAADVIRYGETFSEAGEYMREVIMKSSSGEDDDVVKIALHPFDNQPIWEGNSTIIDELENQLPSAATAEEDAAYRGRALPVDAVLCSVGGGGLLNGLLWRVHGHNGSGSHAVRIRTKHLGVHQIERTGGGPAQFFIRIANIEQPQRGVDEGKIHPKVVESLIK